MSGKSNAFAALFLAVLAAAFPGAAAARRQLAQLAGLRMTMKGLSPTVPEQMADLGISESTVVVAANP
jgi:hypothetical protein